MSAPGMANSRRRYRDEGLVALLMDLPGWAVALTLGVIWLVLVVIYGALSLVFPSLRGANALVGGGLVYVFVLVAFWLALGERTLRRRRLQTASSLYRLRGLTAYEFQDAVGELFRLEGYVVTENKRQDDEDGGVDLEISRGGKTRLVQIKHKWDDVGVKDVRELWGIVASESAAGAVFVTSSRYSRRAQEFADGKDYRLIDGEQFLQLRRELLPTASEEPAHDPVVSEGFAQDLATRVAPKCPSPGCGKTMVAVTMLRGAEVTSQFWSCPDYRREDPRTHHRPVSFTPYVAGPDAVTPRRLHDRLQILRTNRLRVSRKP